METPYSGFLNIEGDTLTACSQESGMVIVPPQVKVIGESAFEDSGVEYVILPEGLHTIEKMAFAGCPKLYMVDMSKTDVKIIPPSAFSDCPELHYVHFPDCLREIGEWAFSECNNLQEVILPGYVTKVGKGAFNPCRNVKRVVIPECLGEVESDSFAFYTHSLDYMMLPEQYGPDKDNVGDFAFGEEYIYISPGIHFYNPEPDWDNMDEA